MGRSRGGLTTKIHAVVDANGLPITLKLTEGQAHDGRSAHDMLDTVVRPFSSPLGPLILNLHSAVTAVRGSFLGDFRTPAGIRNPSRLRTGSFQQDACDKLTFSKF